MARTTAEIQEIITSSYVLAMSGVGIDLNPRLWSVTNIQRLSIHTFASSAALLEQQYELFMAEVAALVKLKEPHKDEWYAEKAKQYQHGFELTPGSDSYENTGISEAAVIASRIVKYAAATTMVMSNGRERLRMKVATEAGGDLAQLSDVQLAGFTAYMDRVKDSGVRLDIVNRPPDRLKLTLTIEYDPLILDAEGRRLDGISNDPVREAITTYLKSMSFNGRFVLAHVVDALQIVKGVNIPTVTSAHARYGNTDYIAIPVQYVPDAGYLRIYEPQDLNIQFVPSNGI